MKPHILICGQKGKRIAEFRAAFDRRAKLVFHEQDEGVGRRFADQARGADVAFVCVGATGHDVVQVLKRVGTPIRYVNGAASGLHAALRDWLANWKPPLYDGEPQHTNGRKS